MANLFDTKDHAKEFDVNDIAQNKTMGIISYISLLVLVPIFGAKDSEFAKFHAKNGLLITAVQIVLWITFGLLGLIPYAGYFFWFLNCVTTLILAAYSVFGIVNAAQGRARELPIIGDKIKIMSKIIK